MSTKPGEYQDKTILFFDAFIDCLNNTHAHDWSDKAEPLAFRKAYSNTNLVMQGSRYLFVHNFPDQDPCMIGYMLKVSQNLQLLEITEVWQDMNYKITFGLKTTTFDPDEKPFKVPSENWLLYVAKVAIKFYNMASYNRHGFSALNFVS